MTSKGASDRSHAERSLLGSGRWRWIAAGVAVVVLGVATLLSAGQVPLLSAFDLGVHEFGHLLLGWLPAPGPALGGTFVQFGVPMGLAAYFALARRDLPAAAVMFAWAGSTLVNVAIYLGDAVDQALPLIGGAHDWAYVLGPEVFAALPATAAISAALKALALALFVGAGVIVALGWWESGRA
jgi:hypothetical protein